MGIADLIPGISGGTIALITNISDESDLSCLIKYSIIRL